MTKNVEEDINNSVKGGLSMFSMDFASNGLSWAGNVFQKWENACLDKVIVQEPLKYVDAFGERFRKIYEKVAEDWLNPFADGSVSGLVSDLSVKQDVIDEVCKKCKTSPDGYPVNDDSSLLTDLEPVVSSEKDLSPGPTQDISEDANHEEVCDMVNTNASLTPSEVKRFNFSDETRENLKEVSDPFTLIADSSDYPTPAHAIPSLCPEDKVGERGLILSGCTMLTELNDTLMSQEGMSLVGYFGKEEEEQNSANDLESSMSVTENTVPECSSYGFDMEEATKGDDSVDANREPTEEFEDVSLDDHWDDAELNELVSTLYQERRKMSYKQKLRYAIASKLCRSKNHQWAANRYNDTDMDKRVETTTASSVSCKALDPERLPTRESFESDWELV